MKTLTSLRTSGILIALLGFITISCDKDEFAETTQTVSNIELENEDFDFAQFGKTHNAYLNYVYQIEDKHNAEARFEYGKTFVDPTFGSFDKGLKFEDIKRAKPGHLRRTQAILNGTYRAEGEDLSPAMTNFLNALAQKSKDASQEQLTLEEFQIQLDDLADEVGRNHEIVIDLNSGVSNDGATMLAITSILKYSTEYWLSFENGGGDTSQLRLGNGKIKRALADAWGYVSAWTNNGDGSYSWSHGSALVNADCVSDSVREN